MIPSTNICSPTVNGLVLNPSKGVVKKHVTTPLVEDCIVDIPTPLLLLTVNKFLLLKLSPDGCSNMLTDETELD